MPYIFKSVIQLADQTLMDSQQILMVESLQAYGFVTKDFNQTKYKTLRDAAQARGDLLARGAVISADGKQIIVTMIWKSKEVYDQFRLHPDAVEYNTKMRNEGWSFNVTEVHSS